MGPALLQQVPNPFYGVVTNGALSGPTIAREQLLLPFPQYTGVTIGGTTTFGASSYNALQVKLEKRYSSGLSFLFAFTWSKLMDNLLSSQSGFQGGAFFEPTTQDWDNIKANRTLSDFDIPKLTSISSTYELPFGHKKAFFNKNGFADRILGGWQINTIVSLQSGSPFTVLMANNQLHNNGNFQFANYNGGQTVRPGPAKNKLNGYFNVASFSDPGPFTYGNLPRIFGACGHRSFQYGPIRDQELQDIRQGYVGIPCRSIQCLQSPSVRFSGLLLRRRQYRKYIFPSQSPTPDSASGQDRFLTLRSPPTGAGRCCRLIYQPLATSPEP